MEVVALFVHVAGAALRVALTGHDVLPQLLQYNILLAPKFLVTPDREMSLEVGARQCAG